MKFFPHPLLACLSTRAQGQQVINLEILENSSVIVHRSMTGSHRWQKTGIIAVLLGKARFEVEVKISCIAWTNFDLAVNINITSIGRMRLLEQ